MIPIAKPFIGDEERAAVDRVLRSGGMAQGPEVEAFEKEFSSLVGGRHCVAVNSGTSALHLALIAMGIGAGDEVIVPSFSFAASANAVCLAGATPVFVDIDADTYCISPAAVEAAVGPKTAAVMPVHLYGHPAAMAELEAVASRHSLAIIEDAAQAHAAVIDGRNVGEFGLTACFSFYPTKNMTTGEGGLVVTPSDEVARMLRLLRNQGMERRYENEVVGFNVRMTDIAAAIGRVQLTRLAGWTADRQRNAAYLTERLTAVTPPTVAPGATHVYHQYTVRSDDRDGLHQRLTDRGVGSGVYYPIPIHRLPSFALDLDLPVTAKAADEVLSLPVHPALTTDDLDAIVAAVNNP